LSLLLPVGLLYRSRQKWTVDDNDGIVQCALFDITPHAKAVHAVSS